MRIALISAAFPPDLDGIGDYTWWMAKTLVELGHQVTVFTRKGAVTDVPGGAEVVGFYETSRPSSFADLVPALRTYVEAGAQPDWMVLQYNPFSWGPRGWCPAVPETLRRIEEKPCAPRIAAMVHETMVPPWPWKFAIMRLWQRPLLAALCQTADQIFVSTERWLPEVASVCGHRAASVLPVGSNIPKSSLSRDEAKRLLGLSPDTFVIGVFGGAHVSRQLDWIAAAAKALTQTKTNVLVLHVGPDGDVLERVCQELPIRLEGILDGMDVAHRLRAMDVLLSPFVDGISTRRTSVMAALANGLPAATTVRNWTDPIFADAPGGSVLLSTAETNDAFTADVMRWAANLDPTCGDCIAEFSDLHFGWPFIARAMCNILEVADEAGP